MNWFDAVLAILLLLAVFRGWARGVVAVVLGIGGLVAALLLSRALAEPVMAWLDDRFGWVASTRDSLARAATPAFVAGSGGIPGAGEGLPVDPAVWQELPIASRWLAETYDRLAVAIWTFILAAVLFAVLSVAIQLVAKLVTRGLDLTPLALPNRLLGAGLNLALNGFMLGSICAILLSVPSLDWPPLAESRFAPQLTSAVQSLLAAALAAAR